MRACLIALLLYAFASALALRGAEFALNTSTAFDQEHVAVTQLTNGTIVFAWEDESTGISEIWFRRYDSNLVALGAPARAHAVATSHQTDPAIARLTNGFVIAWSAAGIDGSDYGVAYRRFDVNGNALDGAPQVANTTTAGAQLGPDVAALTDGAFVITWSDQSGADQDIRYRRFNGDGTPSNLTDLRANGWGTDSRLAGDQGSPRVAALPSGGFIIVYEDRQSDDIYAVRFDGAGNPLGAPSLPSGYRQLLINQQVAFEQTAPSVATFTNGSFVVAFNSETNGTPESRRVVARFFTPTADASNQVVLGSHTNRTQNPRVAAFANGTFVTAMQTVGVGPDSVSNAWSVLIQRAGTNGTVLTPAFIANSYNADDQVRPTLLALRDASYVLAWQSYGQDSSAYGVYAQRFTTAAEPAGGRLLIARSAPAGAAFELTFTNGAPYAPYRLQATTNLTSWTTLQTTNTSNGVFKFTETQGGAIRARSYRVITP